MANPWTKKNPFMSMWLSGANTVAGQAKAVAARQQKAVARDAARAWTGFWLGAPKPKRRSRKSAP